MKKFLILFVLGYSLFVNAQTELVFVFFKDKPNKANFYANPISELTQKSLDRRTTLNIPLNDQDAPIEPNYIQNIKDLGFTVTDYSKWLNGVAVNATAAQITQLSQQTYVHHVESFVRNSGGKLNPEKNEKFKEYNNEESLTNFNYGTSLAQINQVNLRELHVVGFTGIGISIAVIDTGFPTVDTGSAYKRLRDNGHIKGGYNFVNKSTDIFSLSLNTHGSYCLGIIGGYLDSQFIGSAPDADFYLYVSEDGSNEIPEEELYWIEAAEEADRKGVDIISSSLSYNEFDDSRYNYTYADMNGTTSFIARGAQIAAEKGIFLTNSAGNNGRLPWHYISTPADNAKVFTIGAVDPNGTTALFSSYGPNSAGVIKPDASARGLSAYTVYENEVKTQNGTSLSNPLAAGGIACLLQALDKNIPREEIRFRLKQNASLYPNYTAQKGYGILNFYKTYQSYLGVNDVNKVHVKIYPNPVKDFININSENKINSVKIYDYLGRLIKTDSSSKINISQLSKGNYLLKIKTSSGETIEKFIKE